MYVELLLWGSGGTGFIYNPIIRPIARISLPAILEEERARNFCRPVGIMCMGERREGGGQASICKWVHWRVGLVRVSSEGEGLATVLRCP